MIHTEFIIQIVIKDYKSIEIIISALHTLSY